MPRRPGAPRTHRVSAAAGRGGWRGGRPQPAPTGRSTVCCPPPRRAERARAGAAANPGAAPHLPPAPTLPAAAAPPAAPERGLPRSPAYLPMAGSRRPGGEGGEGQGLALPCLAGLDCAAPGWGGRRGSGQRRQLAHWRAPLRLRRLRRGERGGDGPACLRRPRGSRLDRPGHSSARPGARLAERPPAAWRGQPRRWQPGRPRRGVPGTRACFLVSGPVLLQCVITPPQEAPRNARPAARQDPFPSPLPTWVVGLRAPLTFRGISF